MPMSDPETPPPSAPPAQPYVVLARKYRPLSFTGLIGQDAMVRTLRNAFRSGRIPHAFILTGIRGVGKTTTARILARALNFEDETGRHPNLELDREGVHDRAIIEGRHVDVIEMDAASNTGIDDIREIIDSVKYAPAAAPFKVYIIDEVHMLSTQAFNGLLKTLEEPPPYVKFNFATTEIRKVPVTILSRCMRFDLRRVPSDVMLAHLEDLLGREGIGFEPEALAMIVRAGEGSVRDNQSLLDQAISHGDGKVTAQTVKAMLGLGDRARVIDLFEALCAGDIASALGITRELYDAGADPQTILSDLCDFTHLVTRIKVVPAAADDVSLTPDERSRGTALSQRLGMRVLSRAWQIIFHGFEEVAAAGNALQAAEMVLVRLAYAADLPTPDEVIQRLEDRSASPSAPSSPPARHGGGGGSQALRVAAPAVAQPQPSPAGAPQAALPNPTTYAELVALAGDKRDLIVKLALESSLKPLSFAPGRIELALADGADTGIISVLTTRLRAWTGRNWLVTVSNETHEHVPTIRELRAREDAERQAEAHEDPLVRAILETFPGARLQVRALPPAMEEVPVEAYMDAFSEEDDDE
jgi:DNA polymerase-3 subunit gamma/tau